jgi:maleylacetoacetate isomerase
MTLYDTFRASAAYRVRIALNLKGVTADRVFVRLRQNAQRSDEYLALNPQGLVPSLITDDGDVLTQSLAIIEWLDETHPSPPLLPAEPAARARVRALALAVACEIHPLNNTPVLNYLTGTLGATDAQKDGWYRYWCDVGLEAIETRLVRESATGRYCHGDTPTLADVCLVPQLANARRFAVDVDAFPTLQRIDAACAELPAFAAAVPARQPDADA